MSFGSLPDCSTNVTAKQFRGEPSELKRSILLFGSHSDVANFDFRTSAPQLAKGPNASNKELSGESYG